MKPLRRTLIVDDDPLSRKRIRALLEEDGEFELLGECENGREGIEAIRRLSPDLVFLDVQMPEVDGFGVVAEIGAAKMPVVIFVSAYVDFAIRAFEAYALDYLPKPFDDERFGVALQRAKDQLRLRTPEQDERMAALLEFVGQARPARYPEVLAIKSGDQYTMVRIPEIDWIEADGNYVRLHIGKTARLVSKTLTELETRVLDPDRFVRVHRSTIINLERIASIEPLFHGEYSIQLTGGTRVTASRRYRQQLRDRVYFTS